MNFDGTVVAGFRAQVGGGECSALLEPSVVPVGLTESLQVPSVIHC